MKVCIISSRDIQLSYDVLQAINIMKRVIMLIENEMTNANIRAPFI